MPFLNLTQQDNMWVNFLEPEQGGKRTWRGKKKMGSIPEFLDSMCWKTWNTTCVNASSYTTAVKVVLHVIGVGLHSSVTTDHIVILTWLLSRCSLTSRVKNSTTGHSVSAFPWLSLGSRLVNRKARQGHSSAVALSRVVAISHMGTEHLKCV